MSYPVNHAAGGLLRDFLHAYLPPDAAERCRDVAHVHVTRVLPTFRPEVVSHFHDKDDLVQALITSAHIPYYANGKLVTEWRGRYDVGTHGLLGRLAGLNTNSRQLLSSRNSSKVEGSAGLRFQVHLQLHTPQVLCRWWGCGIHPSPAHTHGCEGVLYPYQPAAGARAALSAGVCDCGGSTVDGSAQWFSGSKLGAVTASTCVGCGLWVLDLAFNFIAMAGSGILGAT